MTVKHVLSIDDRGDTIADLIGLLKRRGVSVTEVKTIETAKEALQRLAFDFILADARLPVGNELEMSAGQKLLAELQRGDLGPLNQETQCMILTSYPYEVNREQVDLENYRGLLSKLSMSPEIIGDMMGIDLSEQEQSGPGEEIRRQLIEVQKPYNPADKFVQFVALGAEGQTILVNYPVADLPPEVRFRYRHAERPLLVWASLNVAASHESEVRPRSFELYLGDPVERLEQAWKDAER
jgi:CheY-like chemotaxis protein